MLHTIGEGLVEMGKNEYRKICMCALDMPSAMPKQSKRPESGRLEKTFCTQSMQLLNTCRMPAHAAPCVPRARARVWTRTQEPASSVLHATRRARVETVETSYRRVYIPVR